MLRTMALFDALAIRAGTDTRPPMDAREIAAALGMTGQELIVALETLAFYGFIDPLGREEDAPVVRLSPQGLAIARRQVTARPAAAIEHGT